MRLAALASAFILVTTAQTTAQAQPPQMAPGDLAEKMSAFEMMHGEWRGTAKVFTPAGVEVLTQTERVGPIISGDVLMVEGRGYDEDGDLSFNAVGLITYDPMTQTYEMRSHAMGRTGTFPITPTENGYTWVVEVGPGMSVEYVATFDGDTWTETGAFLNGDQPPVPTIKMELKRIGDTDWPAAGFVAAE